MTHRYSCAAAGSARSAYIQVRFLLRSALTAQAHRAGVLLASIVLAAGLLAAGRVQAEASLFIYPTLVMFDGHRTSAEVTVSNRGDETGTFEIDWANMSMTPTGGLVRHDDDVAWSVQPFLRYSPRRVTLAPAESQVVKIALRRDPAAPEGEYFAHMRVVTINSAALEAGSGDAPSAEAGVSITARPAIAIPVIWRNSATAPSATIESIDVDASGQAIVLDVARHGLLSVRGYVHIIAGAESAGAGPESGKSAVLAEPFPLILYPSIDRRRISVPLPGPLDVDSLPGDAVVVFASEDELTERTTIYSSRPITPSP